MDSSRTSVTVFRLLHGTLLVTLSTCRAELTIENNCHIFEDSTWHNLVMGLLRRYSPHYLRAHPCGLVLEQLPPCLCGRSLSAVLVSPDGLAASGEGLAAVSFTVSNLKIPGSAVQRPVPVSAHARHPGLSMRPLACIDRSPR